ncbi:TIGR00159 family protein [Thermoactinomyces intermedius]|jgi:diadenylate cyclase|uniref:Diadenylate cyclase n=1 Tax=Thermoactinomyces intermedius TaxID=2024 RepID=A0A8I1DG01_THEIN|nr:MULTISPECIES: diadenylate cyclase CdaA [Thermoactinomyces]MBA4549776.1 TIGR00159 family protein [Thermoactinomyces intermedius]MBA4837447.1 TIGR00159 family protein [Thermoactinomyces intermedius]MBH8596100.1 TIGR00159 family protein [Thermoactinomyces intermedius]MBH8602380.1 TIGR00159 family protein [Thermoactinomyces sp. CICC 23799]
MQSLAEVKNYLSDVVDILIVSYVIYHLLKLMRGTRAVQLLKGITVLLVIWLISNEFELKTLEFFIENFFSVGLIAVIVIFQPELRRALEQLGRGYFFGRSSQVEDQIATKIVSEVTKAVVQLAKQKIGALIVIEKDTGLSDYIETGTVLEARLSAELLKNIFIPKAPLHDGAVIIREESVMAAGCYLPLSENPYISKDLGTRHRAGIGLSEVTDAVVVIASEETGQISLAYQGELERNLSEDELVSRLYELLKPPEKFSTVFWMRKEKEEGKEKDE